MKNKPDRYSVDKNNCLIVERNKAKLAPRGSFSIDNKNRLTFLLNEPRAWKRKYFFPDKIVFTGKWSLNTNHDLELKINNANTLSLRGEIISAGSDKLGFQIISYAGPVSSIRILELSGSWGSDEANRIFFAVTGDNKQDIIKFQSGWNINQNQQIVYSYQKTRLRTKTKIASEFVIDGFWEVTAANRLRYIISRANDSMFNFKAQLESPTLYPKDGQIRYRLGVGLKEDKRLKEKIISLYGDWKLNRKLGLMFEMEYKNNVFHSLIFEALVNFNANNQVVFNLKDKLGKNLDMSVVFTHKFLKQSGGDWFLRFDALHNEKRINAGLRIPF